MSIIPFSGNTVSFKDLSKIITKGNVRRDCIISFVDKLSNVKYIGTAVFATNKPCDEVLDDKRISGIIVPPSLAPFLLEHTRMGVWECEDPQDLFFSIHEYFAKTNFMIKPWINNISVSAVISPNALIADHSVTIGDNCVIEDGAVIHPYSIIGNCSRIGSLCDIGSDGFEVHVVNGVQRIIPHGGIVIIGDNVELLSMIKVTRGLSLSRNTVIGDNVKVDSMTHIAHGVMIGKDSIITGCVTIAGNVTIGRNVYIGPSATISNRLIIRDNSYIALGSVVITNLKKDSKVSGNFAVPHEDNLSRQVFLRKALKSK